MRRREFIVGLGGAVAWPLAAGYAQQPAMPALGYPTRPISIVVRFAAGGPTDTIARIIGERMKTLLGQTVLIENVTGADGSIGVGRVVRAAPDGYTLSLGDLGSHVANQVTHRLTYNLQQDLQPVSLVFIGRSMVVARSGMPGGNLKELVDWLRANPNKATAGTGGLGGAEHLAGLMFQNITGTRFQFIPYRGSAPAVQDMLSDQIDMIFGSPVVTLPHIQAGRLKAYAIMSKSRLESLPDVPTVDEAGAPGAYYQGWLSLWAPKGTPKNIIAKLSSAVTAALADPAVKVRFVGMGGEVPPPDQQSPESLATFHQAEINRWWPIIKAAGIKAE